MMRPRALVRRARSEAIGAVERWPAADRGVRRVAAAVARRRGVPAELTAAMTGPTLPLDRALQLFRWACALMGTGRFPRHFDPGDHLVDPAARRAAASLLRDRDTGAEPRLRRALVNVDDSLDLAAAADEVDRHLRARLAERSRRPHGRPIASIATQRELLEAVSGCLDRAGTRTFLMSGTLLGFRRDGGFLETDYDVDLGVLPGVTVEHVADALRAGTAYEVTVDDERVEVTHPDGAHCDVFTHREQDGRWWHSTRIHRWWNTPFELVPAEIDGIRVWVPDDPERYLAENYGAWSKRPAFYDMTFDTPNREYRHDLAALRYLHHRCLKGIEAGDRWSVESAARELRDGFGVDVTDLLIDTPLLD